jgi:hypothetical protein
MLVAALGNDPDHLGQCLVARRHAGRVASLPAGSRDPVSRLCQKVLISSGLAGRGRRGATPDRPAS